MKYKAPIAQQGLSRLGGKRQIVNNLSKTLRLAENIFNHHPLLLHIFKMF